MEKGQIYPKFLEVSKKTGVPIKQILDVFLVLSTGDPVDNDKLLCKVGVSRNALNQIKHALSPLLKPSSRNTQLTTEASRIVRGLYSSNYKSEEVLLSFLEDNHFQETLELLKKYQGKRPTPKREYDQFTATPETTARRAVLLHFFDDIKGKNVLFLGDDDFTSVAAASLKEAKNVTVVDIDQRILNEIAKISKDQNFGIKTIEYNARKLLPNELKGRFDVVFTDPPYTSTGMQLFVSRAVEALDPSNLAARIYACYGNSDRAKERFLPIYGMLTDSGLMVRWVFDKFNRYHGAESIGSSSSLFVCEVTPKTKPLVQGNYDKPIYTHN